MDYSKKHKREVTYFGLWAEEGSEKLGDGDAWDVLCRAAQKSPYEDISEESKPALEWFEKRLIRPRPVKDFRKALEITDPEERFYALQSAMRSLKQFMGC